ncbi:MAG: hypothetical protein AAF747_08780 [Planctomycetota bacterium]
MNTDISNTEQPAENGLVAEISPASESPDNAGLSTETIGQGLVILGIMMLIFMSLRKLRGRRRQANEMDRDPSERIDELQAKAASSGSLGQLVAEAEETAARLAKQLDSKAIRIEALLDRVEQRLGELDERLTGLDERLDASPLSIGQPGGSDEVSPREAPAMTDSAGPPIDPAHVRIHELSDTGMTPIQIAAEVGRPVGQVELILALRRA